MKDPLEQAGASTSRRVTRVLLVAGVLVLALLALLRSSVRYPLAIVVGIVLMVMLHEAGHYVAAKRAGMKTTEFFLGFGPRLWSFRRGETEYGVKAVPAGGYVRIVGMSNLEEIDPADEARTFRRGSYGNRLVVVLAGVTVNAVIAFVLFFAVLAGQGRVAEGPSLTVSRVVAGSAADAAGLRSGDRVVAIDGRPVSGWGELRDRIEGHGGQVMTLTLVRAGQRVDVEATPRLEGGQGFLGVAPRTAFRDIGPLQAAPEALKSMGDVTTGTARGIGRLFSPSGVSDYGRNFTSDAPPASSREAQERPRSLIGIVDEGSRLVEGNVWALLWLLGAISLILALFNVLPLLPFDGGHAAVVGYEWAASRIRGREVRVDFRRLMPVTALVLAIFLTLGLSAMLLDIRDLAGS